MDVNMEENDHFENTVHTYYLISVQVNNLKHFFIIQGFETPKWILTRTKSCTTRLERKL